MSQSTLSFSISSTTRFGPRIGNITFKRPSGTAESFLQIPTPGILASTSRGVISHLSRDHYAVTNAIRWVNIPFETFLEHNPPVPTLQPGQNPLHTFLGFTPGKHVVSMTARDPHDGQEMPPNGNTHVSVFCLRGVRKLSPADWRLYTTACQPDVVFALSDIPFTNPPYSQKRLTKSIERSATWLSNMLHEASLNIFLQMSGATNFAARKAFSESLLEKLYGREAEYIKPLNTLDEGVAGYSFDLVPLRQSLEAIERKKAAYSYSVLRLPDFAPDITSLLKVSLAPLPDTKPRLVNSVSSPHEILHYISDIGIDLFDAHWAQTAADIGVALDFAFPVRKSNSMPTKQAIGHNLYDLRYTVDFGVLADSFRSALTESDTELPICFCAACSPIKPTRIYHGGDTPSITGENPISHDDTPTTIYQPHYSRAYIHHLLHTHEMSAHALLVMHNLEVLDAFFAGVRAVIAEGPDERWVEEVEVFRERYDESSALFEEAKISWKEVDLARGKGRLAREKQREEVADLLEE